jgi:toxin CptA
MAKSRPWSSASAPCRLEWKSSRLLGRLLILLGLLAAGSILASELPKPLAIPLALACLAHGARLGSRELLRPARHLVIPCSASAVTVDGVAMGDVQLHWRGPLAFLRWRDGDGRRQRLLGWPDNLAAAARRELRLAMAARTPARSPRSMAP